MPETSKQTLPLRRGIDAYQQVIAAAHVFFPVPSPDQVRLPLSAALIDLAVRPLVARGPLAPPPIGTRKQARPTLARDIVSEPGACVLLGGEAGAGKTLFLQALAASCATAALSPAPDALPMPESWLGNPPLPLLLDARDLEGTPAPGANGAAYTLLAAWVERTLQQYDLADLTPDLIAALEQGRCLVLIDNADSPELFLTVAGIAEGMKRRHTDNRVVIGSRIPHQLASVLSAFRAFILLPLELAQLDRFSSMWHTHPQVTSLADEQRQQRTVAFQAALRASEELRTLATQPLLMVVCAQTHSSGIDLPRQRAVAYDRAIRVLLERGGSLPCSVEQAMIAFAALANALIETPALPASQLTTLLGPQAEQLVACGLHGGLLRPTERGRLTLAAPALTRLLAAYDLLRTADPAMHAYSLHTHPAWHEVLCLAATLMPTAELRRLVELLLGASQALLAAALIVEHANYEPFADLVGIVQEQLCTMLNQSGTRLPDRVRAGLLLGHLGDPRTESLWPDVVDIPEGPFLLGDDHGGYDDEMPATWHEVRAFQIGRYPVTNREYARFLADNPRHPQPQYWNDPVFNNPSQPVVGVTWHDAQFYCRWLTDKLSAEGLLPINKVVRLPSEVEWEKAACWDTTNWAKRRYPWGDEWEDGYANITDGTSQRTPTPIGTYPEGVGPYGLHDMIGNVWEWTSDEYVNYPGAKKPFYEPNTYVLRGSSCQSLSANARCTYRGRLPPAYWRYHLGFRIVIGDETA